MTTSSSFSPTAPTPNNRIFQVDTWQGAWQAATNGGGNFSGTTSALQQGFHILYAFSTDGQEATSTNTGTQSSPLISNIAAYGFTLGPPPAPAVGLVPTSLSFPNQAAGTTSNVQTVTLDGASLAQVKVKVTTTGRAGALPPMIPPNEGARRVLPLLLMALLGLGTLAQKSLRVKEQLCASRAARAGLKPGATRLVLAAAMLALLLWASCGGGGMNFNSGGTPAGNFTLTITGTYANPTSTGPATLTNSTTVGLRVN